MASPDVSAAVDMLIQNLKDNKRKALQQPVAIMDGAAPQAKAPTKSTPPETCKPSGSKDAIKLAAKQQLLDIAKPLKIEPKTKAAKPARSPTPSHLKSHVAALFGVEATRDSERARNSFWNVQIILRPSQFALSVSGACLGNPMGLFVLASRQT